MAMVVIVKPVHFLLVSGILCQAAMVEQEGLVAMVEVEVEVEVLLMLLTCSCLVIC